MTESKELRTSYTDLKVVVITCAQCGAEVSLNLADARQQRPFKEGNQMVCSVCRVAFDSTLTGALTALQEWLRLAKESKVQITFRLSVKP